MAIPVDELDVRVRIAVYDGVIADGVPPCLRELAGRLALPPASVAAALERLAAGKVLVLQQDSREVLMAAPFSAVPTPFAVRVGDRFYFGNCIWDALAIPAMLSTDARIDCACGCCGEAMQVSVSGGELVPSDGVVHFAIPARDWWRDIVHC